jgi:hypothetical protein
MRAVLAVIPLTIATQAGAVVWDENFKIRQTAAIAVFIDDKAKGACWKHGGRDP